MKRKEHPVIEDEAAIPAWVSRFDALDPRWYESADDRLEWVDRFAPRRRRWDDARREWAAANGFDLGTVHGTKPESDWWAFLKAVRGAS